MPGRECIPTTSFPNEAFLDVESGRYNDISEIMDEALRLWEQQKSATTRLKNEAMTGYEDVLAGRITEISSEDKFLVLARGGSQ